VFRAAARRDLDAAFDWYAARHVVLAERFLGSVDLALNQAGQLPESHPLVFAAVRAVRVRGFPYRVLFRVNRSDLIVVAVFHIRRDAWNKSIAVQCLWYLQMRFRVKPARC
jgi:toxin ParE1/3/4